MGDSKTLVYNLRLSTPGKAPAHVEVEPTMVAFIDRTVVGDSISIARMTEMRKWDADETADLISDLKAASAEKSPYDAIVARVSALGSSPTNSPQSRRAQNLSRYQELAKGGKSVLDQVVEPLYGRQRLIALHSTLTEIKQQ